MTLGSKYVAPAKAGAHLSNEVNSYFTPTALKHFAT